MPDFIIALDNSIADFMISLQNSFLTVILTGVTWLSDGRRIWTVLGLCLLACKKTRKFGIIYAVTLLCAFLFSEYTIKLIVCRERPFVARDDIKLLIPAPSGFSFPSSHSCSSFACAVCIALHHKRFAPLALSFAFIVAFSRLYFTVHYFTDVLAGSLLGAVWAIIVFAVFKKSENRKKSSEI